MTEDVSLPPSWCLANLGGIGEVISGGTPSTKDPANFDGDIAWITPADLTGFTQKTISRGRRNISERGLRSSSARVLPKGAVLFSSRAPIGYVAIAANELATNQGFKSLALHDGFDPDYVYYYLKNAKSLAEDHASGTTFKEISGTRFASLPIPIAPLPEQRRIVEKIETLFARLDKGEEAVRQVQQLLKRYRQSVLKAAVTGELIGSSQEGWPETEIGAHLSDIRYGTAKKCTPKQHGTAVLRIPNVVGGEIDLQDLKYTDLTEKEGNKLALEKGDLLIVRSNGSANLVGRGAVVGDEAVGLAYAGYLIRLRLDQSTLLPEFLHLVLNSPQIRTRVERQARSTSGVHNINSGEVQAITFRLPSLQEQAEIIARAERDMAKVADLETWCETELARSAALRQSILKQAFSGHLVPQDPSDEPASALLAHVRAVAPVKKTRKANI